MKQKSKRDTEKIKSEIKIDVLIIEKKNLYYNHCNNVINEKKEATSKY